MSSETSEKARPRSTPNARPIIPLVFKAIAGVAIERSLPASVLERFSQAGPGAFVVQVPTEQWAEAIEEAIADMVPLSSWVFSETQTPKRVADTYLKLSSLEVAKRLSAGDTVIGISQDPEVLLPSNLRIAADVYTVKPIDGVGLVEVLRRCATGRVPKRTTGLRAELLTFEELAALVPYHHPAADVVRSVEAAIERKSVPPAAGDNALPDLADCIEYGQARDWALNLAEDIRDLQQGKITWEDCDRGAIFFGPTGTGKTMLAQLIGKACGIPSIVSSVADLFASSSGYLDAVIKAQRALFERARTAAPCILFLDELNALPNVDTVAGRNRDYWMPVVLDFYTLLDSAVSDRAGVIVIGATNRIQDINPAILRPGRLERAIFVGPPDAAGAERILKQHLNGDLLGVDLKNLAKAAEAQELTGAVLMEAVRAARRSARRRGEGMNLSDLQTAILPNAIIDQALLARIATHEAGHAMIGAILVPDRLIGADILGGREVGTLGRVRFKAPANFATAETIKAEVAILLAGRAAEEVLLGVPSSGSGGDEESDIARATRLLFDLHASYGLGDTLLWRSKPAGPGAVMRLDQELTIRVEKELDRVWATVLQQLRERREGLRALVERLIEQRSLTARDILEMVAAEDAAAGEFINHN